MTAFPLILLLFSAAGDDTAVDFETEVMPVLTKAGCNTGACHGAAVGRGQFKLSLYGGDPSADYRAIVHELEGRRINLARPADSLLFLKSTESIEHGGGPRLDLDGPGAKRLLQWIQAGAPRPPTRGRLTRLQVSPLSSLVREPGNTVPLQATAHFDNGSTVDVTSWTVFTSADPGSVSINSTTAIADVKRHGRHIVLARFMDQVVPVELLVPYAHPVVDLSPEPRVNFIDEHVFTLLSKMRVPTSPMADDATFLRRLHLDLAGRVPTPDQVTAYLADKTPDKRDQLITRLLASDAFTQYWTYRFAKLLRIRSQSESSDGARAFHQWLGQQIAEGTGYDQIAREVLLSAGDTHEVGPANFYRNPAGARSQAELVSELFLGSRLRCANCHNHPLDRWTQDDYHGLAAVFAKIDRGRIIKIKPTGEVIHPRTQLAAIPRIPGEHFLGQDADGREQFTRWLTDPENPYFARAVVNRLWKALMGRGLVEPTDDLRATNPATHPALLDQLTADFIKHEYDLRHTIHLIASSATYGRSGIPPASFPADNRYYAHALARPLEPEVLIDALADVTGVSERYDTFPAGTRAITLFDPSTESETLDILGRCSREDSCETTQTSSGGLSRKLHLVNGPLINRRLAAPSGRLAMLIANGHSWQDILNTFYIRALGRLPNAKERQFWAKEFSDTNGRQKQQLEDFVWSLLTSREFQTNH